MKPLEHSTEQSVVDWAKKNGIRQAKLAMPGQAGYPDRIFFIPGGRPVLIEFKRKDEMPTKLQQYILDSLADLGYLAIWSDDAEEAIAYIKKRIGYSIYA